MELIHIPNCSLLYLHSNDMNSDQAAAASLEMSHTGNLASTNIRVVQLARSDRGHASLNHYFMF